MGDYADDASIIAAAKTVIGALELPKGVAYEIEASSGGYVLMLEKGAAVMHVNAFNITQKIADWASLQALVTKAKGYSTSSYTAARWKARWQKRII